jgi:hypothetical protein
MARDYGYIISPSLTWYTFTKGQQVSDELTFTNSFISGEPEEQTFVLTTNFVFQENGEKKIYDTVPTEFANYDLTEWISIEKTEFTLKQNESIKIPYTITVPLDPQPGGKFAAIVITKKSSIERLPTTGAALEDKIAYQILGSIAGSEQRDSEIIDFTVNKPIFWWWPNEKATFEVTLRNKGNVAFLPSGDIFVHQGNITRSIWNTSFNSTELVILPQNTRAYAATWEPSGPFLKSTPNGLTINLDYLRIGRYIATAKVGYDQNGSRIVADRLVTFWILPIPLIVAILTVILVIFGSILWRKRKSRK